MKRKDWQQIIVRLAGPEIVAGGALALSALNPCWSLRTTTNGFLGGDALETPIKVVEGGAS